MCYFSRRFSSCGCTRTAFRNHKIRGVAQYGEKGWRTDQVGSPGTHLQRHGALPQASRKRIRFAGWRDQEEPARKRPVHAAWSVEDEGRQEGGHQGPRRSESLHRREDDVQGEAREQESSRHATEEPEGHGQHLNESAFPQSRTKARQGQPPCRAFCCQSAGVLTRRMNSSTVSRSSLMRP